LTAAMIPSLLMQALHEKNPYDGFNPAGFKQDLQGWNSERPVFHELIDRVQPRLVIEAGVWKGASAIHMGSYLRRVCPEARLLAIDTWLGSWDFWDRQRKPGLYKALTLRQGFPAVYPQFLFNVLHQKLEEMIIPFPQTSLGACRWLKQQGVTAELIYIDAGHDKEDVAMDLKNYFEILAPGGIIFGDDYADTSAGVAEAVECFAAEKKIPLELKEQNQFWVIEKKTERV